MMGPQATRAVLRRALTANPKVHVLGEALELSAATRGLLGEHPSQVHLMPAADPSLVGVALGMTFAGGRAVVELAGPASIPAAFRHLCQEAPSVGVEYAGGLIVRVPLAPGQAPWMDSLMAVPGLVVTVASSPAEAGQLLEAALVADRPVVIFEPAAALGSGPAELPVLGLNAARCLVAGDDVTVLACGAGVGASLAAADALRARGVGVEVIDVRTLTPVDVETIAASVQKTGRPVFVDVPSAVVPAVVTSSFLRLESPPEHVSADEDIGAAIQRSLNY